MKYLKVFETTTEQQSYLDGDIITPSITITRDNETTINYVPEVIEGEDDADKIVNHGVITLEGDRYYLTFQFPIACEYMTVDCIPQYWELRKGSSRTASHSAHFEGLGDTIEIYASNNGYDDYNATNEDDTYIYEVVIEVQKSLITFYIDGTQYEAEEGMNWYEWVNSEYNTIGAEIGYGDHRMVILNGKELKDPNTLNINRCVVWWYNNGDDAPIITENTLYYFDNSCSPL